MKKIFKRVFLPIILAIISLLGILFSHTLFKEDYTDTYHTYTVMKDFSNLNEIKSYLSSKQIEYTIENNKLNLNKYEDISFDISPNYVCTISRNEKLQNLEKLDGYDLSELIIKGNLKDGDIVEEISQRVEKYKYIKELGRYYVINEHLVSIIYIPSLFLFSGVIAFVSLSTINKIFDKISRKSKKKE